MKPSPAPPSASAQQPAAGTAQLTLHVYLPKGVYLLNVHLKNHAAPILQKVIKQ